MTTSPNGSSNRPNDPANSSADITSIFIIKSSTHTLKWAEIYLRNKKWQVDSAIELNECLMRISQQTPQYVLIACDHPNKKVRMLPKLLSDAFSLKTIVFLENTTALSMAALREVNHPYQMFPPVSGTAIERMIIKIRKDEQEIERALQNRSWKTEFSPPDKKFNAQSGADAMPPEEWKKSFEQARSALLQIANSTKSETSNKAFIPSDHTHRNSMAATSSRSGATLNYKKTLHIAGKEVASPPADSIIARGVIEALDYVSAQDDESPATDIQTVQTIQNSTNATCIIIESPRFFGYLIAVLGKNRRIDPDFIEIVRQRLFEFLNTNGETIEDQSSLEITIKEVAFEAWALEQAEFLRKTIHGSDEIAMAFFPNNKPRAKFEDSVSNKMVQIPLDFLLEDVSVEFDVYVYLPENNRYLLYTPKGKPFQKHQKERLREKGITHMHVLKEATSDIKKYQAQNDLNEKAASYQKAVQSREMTGST